MKTIRKTILTLGLVMFIFSGVLSQEFKQAVNQADKLVINDLLGELLVEGHTGNEIIITVTGVSKPSERANGLKPIYASGVVDNTGLGIAVIENDNVIELSRASRSLEDGRIKILVPANIIIQVEYNSVHCDDVTIKDLSNEIKLITEHADIEVENITGPANIYSTHGEINVVFSEINQGSPISIVSPHGDIDLTLPAQATANLDLYAGFGEIFSNLDIEYNKTKEGLRSYSNHIKGKINGGGVNISIKSDHANIYLRKK